MPSETLADSLKKPTVRAEAVLDGIFAQAVVVVEADGDRTVYQSVWETLADEQQLDIHFAAVGGTGGIADTCALYRTLRIPIAAIADLDIITDSNRCRRVLTALGVGTELEGLTSDVGTIATKIKALPPTISEDDAKKRLRDVISDPLDWSNGSDVYSEAGF